jgi:hypothetical protein
MSKIIVTGDSHSQQRFGWSEIEGSESYHLGPRLMYTFGTKSLKHIEQIPATSEDILLMSFGEIDCRMHVLYRQRPMEVIIDKLVRSYIKSILTLNTPATKGIYGIVPPSRKKSNSPRNWEKKGMRDPLPFIGSDEDRKQAWAHMQDKIKEMSSKAGILHVDPSPYCMDDEGFLDESLADQDSYIHIANGEVIRKALIKAGIRI